MKSAIVLAVLLLASGACAEGSHSIKDVQVPGEIECNPMVCREVPLEVENYISPGGAVVVNREDLEALIAEAEKQDAKLAVVVRESYCEQKMKESMQAMDRLWWNAWFSRRTLIDLYVDNKFSMKELVQWEATMKDCVK